MLFHTTRPVYETKSESDNKRWFSIDCTSNDPVVISEDVTVDQHIVGGWKICGESFRVLSVTLKYNSQQEILNIQTKNGFNPLQLSADTDLGAKDCA